MKKKDDNVYIQHMLESIGRIEEYTQFDKQEFMGSTLVQDAVVRKLQVMAESSQRLSQEMKNLETDIVWRDISGFRNILVHDYLGVDLNMIWSVVELELPRLKKALKKMEAALK